MRELDLDELAKFDGKDGKPAFIAHGGKIYDVSGSKLWKGGSHMRRHRAGADLTIDIQAAPHGTEVLERYQQAGTLKPAVSAEAPIPKVAERLMERFPMLRRHPHPMTVHFPIAFLLATPFFTLLYLLTGSHSLEKTSLHCLGAGLLFLPIVILTGLFSWWVNYLGKPLMPVYVKAFLSSVLFVFGVIAFTWRVAIPDVLSSSGVGGLVYLLLLLSFFPLVGVIGWFGAKLTFPVEHE